MCGDPASGTAVKRRFTRYRFPLWIGGLVLLASGMFSPVRLVGFALMAVSLFTSDGVALDIPLCEEHRNNQDAASLIGRILCFGGLAVALTVSILRAPPLLILASFASALLGIFLMGYGRLRATAIESQFCFLTPALFGNRLRQQRRDIGHAPQL